MVKGMTMMLHTRAKVNHTLIAASLLQPSGLPYAFRNYATIGNRVVVAKPNHENLPALQVQEHNQGFYAGLGFEASSTAGHGQISL
jgi:hypothetical protein